MKSITVNLNDGSSYETSINPDRSTSEIIKYFVGTWFNYGVEDDVMKKCVSIKIGEVTYI